MLKKGLAGIFLSLLISMCCFAYPVQASDGVAPTEEELQYSNEIAITFSPDHANIKEQFGDSSVETPENVFQNIIIPLAIEFFGAFLGVLTALALDSHSSKKQYKEVNDGLRNELIGIGEELKERLREDNYIYYHYLTPVWDINLSAGNLSLLTNSNKRKNHIDQKYIAIYSKIQYAEELEREYVHSKLLHCQDIHKPVSHEDSTDDFATKYIAIIDSARKREAEEIYKMIADLSKDVK